QQRFADAFAAHLRQDKKIFQVESRLASPCREVVMKKRECGCFSAPLGNQAAIFWLRAKAVPDQVIFGGDHRIGLALVLSEMADEVENQSCIGSGGIADGKHTLQVYKG